VSEIILMFKINSMLSSAKNTINTVSECAISPEREGLRTSILVYRCSTKTHISDKRRDLTRSRASDRCWPKSRERNVLGRPKLVGRLSTPRAIMSSSFKAKDAVRRPVSQTSAVTRPVTAETETVSYLLNGKTHTNFRIGTPVEHALSTVTPSYKAVKLGSCTREGAYRVGRTRRPRSLFAIHSYTKYCICSTSMVK